MCRSLREHLTAACDQESADDDCTLRRLLHSTLKCILQYLNPPVFADVLQGYFVCLRSNLLHCIIYPLLQVLTHAVAGHHAHHHITALC